MNTLILYDSQYGNTEQIAQAVAARLGSLGSVQTERVDKAGRLDLRELDLLVLGCPTQKWQPTPAMQSFLANLSPAALDGLAFACFDTRFHKPRWLTGSAARSMTKQLSKMGLRLLGPAESFFVKEQAGPLEAGELERAGIWALSLRDKIAQPAVRIDEN